MSTTETPLLTLSEKAAAKIKELMAEESDGNVGVLRVAVQGGSCSGLEYALGFDRARVDKAKLIKSIRPDMPDANRP